MAKKSKKSTKKAKKVVRGGNAKGNGVSAAGKMRFAMDVCAVSNPFCPEAVGSRWPDNSFTKSSGWSLTNQPTTVTVNASGNGGLLILPTAQNSLASVTGTTATYTTLNSWSLPADIVRWRVTSYGVRLSSTLSKMTAQGSCLVRLFSPLSLTALGTTDLESVRADASMDIPISRLIEDDFYITPMPLGDNARWFQTGTPQDASTIATAISPGWQVVQIGVVGAPASSNPIRVNVYYNFEFVFGDGSASSAFATASPPDRPLVRQTNSSVLSSIGNFLEGAAQKVDSVFKSSAFRVGMRLLGAGATRNPSLLLQDVD